MIARLLLLFSVVGLAGCAGTGPQDEPHEPKANAAWRKSLGDAAFVTLTPGETRQFQITPEFQTFGFPEGISYFVGVALPRSDKPRTLTLRTLPADPLRPRETHVFIPRVAIVALDGSVSRYLELEFQPSTQWIVPRLLARNTGWQGSLTLSPGESRLAVYTATLLRQTLRLHESEEAVEYWYVPSGSTGVIEITLNGD